MTNELLDLLNENAQLTTTQLAAILDKPEAEIIAQIQDFEKNGVIKGYKALINWDKVEGAKVSAIIELKVTPRKDTGFDDIAKRLMMFEEVESVYLMAGAYDLAVMVKGDTMQDIAMFVARKLSTLESVLSTSTHFLLKRYKDSGVVLCCDEDTKDKRSMIL